MISNKEAYEIERKYEIGNKTHEAAKRNAVSKVETKGIDLYLMVCPADFEGYTLFVTLLNDPEQVVFHRRLIKTAKNGRKYVMFSGRVYLDEFTEKAGVQND